MLRSALIIGATAVAFATLLAHGKQLGPMSSIMASGDPARRATLLAEGSDKSGLLQRDARADRMTIDGNAAGQFETAMSIGGRSLPALIDTGATYVVLSADAAASIGIRPAERDFRYAAQTANGVSRSAAVTLPQIRVGNIAVRDVQAFVSKPGALTGPSLIGMSFLRKLSGFEIQAGRLVLKQ